MASEKIYEPGDVIFRQGDPPGPLYVLRSGTLSVVEDGVQIAEIDEVGTVIGEMSQLLDEVRTTDVVALTGCRLEEVEDVEAWIRADADNAVHVVRTLARRLVKMDRAFVEARRSLALRGGRVDHDSEYLPPELDPVRRYFRALGLGT